MKKFAHVPFNHVWKTERVEKDGKRFYSTPEGNLYPSVTSVTGLLSKQAINEWRIRVGDEEANRVSSRASNRGTRIHKLMEDYINNELVQPDVFDYDVYNALRSVVDSKVDNIYCQEVKMYSDTLRMAGTSDLIAEYDGVLSIIDFKTSTRTKDADKIVGYFLQAAAYATMFTEKTSIPIDDMFILIGVDHEPEPQVFHQSVSVWIPGLIARRDQFEKG
jgi:genome maintenance exonuclease 1